MGSLCCVAARPHGPSAGSQQWSMGPNEPYWQTNSSFSPPLSTRWEQIFQSQAMPCSSHSVVQLYGSSLSSNSKGSRCWVRREQLAGHQHSVSDGGLSYFSSPSDSGQTQQYTPSMQRIDPEDFQSTTLQEPALSRFPFPLNAGRSPDLGASSIPDGSGSTSHSDASESEHMAKSQCNFLHGNFSSRCFMSKSVHPLSFPSQSGENAAHVAATVTRDSDMITASRNDLHCDMKSFRTLAEFQPLQGSSDLSVASHHDDLLWSSSSSSIDFTDISEQFDVEQSGISCNISETLKCGICDRLLSQRSPWSSRRIVRSGDMPVVGVLSCRHVYHAECLEQATSKIHRHDPPCPLCSIPDQQVLATRSKNGFPKLKSTVEDGGAMTSKSWTCGQWRDCVEETIQPRPRGSLPFLNKHHSKQQCTKRGSSSKDLSESVLLRKAGSYSQFLNGRRPADQAAGIGCSRPAPSSHSIKRW